MPKGQGRSATSKGFYFLQAMTEEQVQTAKTEATAQVEEGVEEMSEEDLEGVAGGACPSFPGSTQVKTFECPS